MAYYDDIAALTPDFWLKLDGDGQDSADALDSDGGTPPSYVSSIVPALTSMFACGDFNGSSSILSFPTSNNLIGNAVTYQKSVSLWFVADTLDATGNGRTLWGEGGSQNAFIIYVYDNGATTDLYVHLFEGGVVGDVLQYTITTGTLYHVVVTMDCTAGELILYVNGSPVDSVTGGLTIGSELATHTGGVGIAGADSTWTNHNDATMSGFFDGRIADVVYWGEQTVLSASEVAALYASGLGVAYEQEGHQFRLDDGSESGASDIGAQDSDISAAKETNRRLRILSDATGDPPAHEATLQFRLVGDPDSEWEAVE
jgi:hypothetical protein